MELIKIDKHTANKFYSKYEHLGNCGLGVWHYGLYQNDELISVVSFGTVCFDYNRCSLGRLAKNNNTRIIQLTRGGTKFDAHINTPSKTIKLSFSAIRKELGDTLIVAYSDTKWNEIGTIYQACNFHYLGLSNPGGQGNYIIDGKHMSGWVVRKKFKTRSIDKLRVMGYDAACIPLSPKHRYLYINTSPVKKKFITRELISYTFEYPKREKLSVGSMLEIRKSLNLI